MTIGVDPQRPIGAVVPSTRQLSDLFEIWIDVLPVVGFNEWALVGAKGGDPL
jgi:hypothetical protein